MAYLQPLSVLVKQEIIDKLNLSINILTVTDTGVDSVSGKNTYSLKVSDIKWAAPTMQVTISGKVYTIYGIGTDTIAVNIAGAFLPPVTTFNLPTVHYFHGTVPKANDEVSKANKNNIDTMVYFMEIVSEDVNMRDMYREPERLLLFCLRKGEYTKQTIGENSANCLQPMQRLAENLEQIVQLNTPVFSYYGENPQKVSYLPQPNFAAWSKEKGMDISYFSAIHLAGVQMEINTKIYIKNIC